MSSNEICVSCVSKVEREDDDDDDDDASLPPTRRDEGWSRSLMNV